MIYLLLVLFCCFLLTKLNLDRFLTVSVCVVISYVMMMSPEGWQGALYGINIFTVLSAVIIIVFYKFNKRILYIKKTPNGFIKIIYNQKFNSNYLLSGRIIHGVQPLDSDLKNLPFSQFHKSGPLGQFFAIMAAEIDNKPIAVVGLGAGTIASYAKKNQEITFFEINPAIIEIANNPNFFTYLQNCQGQIRIIAGDALEKIKQEPAKKYAVLIIDAYLENRIPLKFISNEFLNIAFDKLEENGFAIFHATSKHGNYAALLEKVILEMKLKAFYGNDSDKSHYLKEESDWVVISKSDVNLKKLETLPIFERILPRTL